MLDLNDNFSVNRQILLFLGRYFVRTARKFNFQLPVTDQHVMRHLLKIRQTGPCWGVIPYSEELEFKHTRMQSREKNGPSCIAGWSKDMAKNLFEAYILQKY
jgi:hypothetical protein